MYRTHYADGQLIDVVIVQVFLLISFMQSIHDYCISYQPPKRNILLFFRKNFLLLLGNANIFLWGGNNTLFLRKYEIGWIKTCFLLPIILAVPTPSFGLLKIWLKWRGFIEWKTSSFLLPPIYSPTVSPQILRCCNDGARNRMASYDAARTT